MAQSQSRKVLPFFTALVVVWLVALALGQKAMNDYEGQAAVATPDPKSWPVAVKRQANVWHLVLAAHPKCPCSRATVNELNKILARCPGKLETTAYFYRPLGSDESWNKTDLWRSCAVLPQVTVVDDPDGKTAALFGATTSGEVFLSDPQGQLLFHGGITGARGHEGDNDGEDAVIALINGRSTKLAHTPYFGCSLR